MTKILTVTPFFPPDTGGISSHVFDLDTTLGNHGHDITIATPKHVQSNTSDQYKFSKIFRINSIYFPGWPYPTLKSFSIPIDFGKKIDSIIKNGAFDVIHVHGHHYPISWKAISSAQKHGIPSVLTLHGMYALNPNVLGGRSFLEDLFNRYIFSRTLSKTTSVIGLTNQITNYAKQFGIDSIKYTTIPNGVNVSSYKNNIMRKEEYREKYNIDKEKRVILFCGRFEKVKGITEFAIAAKNLVKNGKTEVIIVGGGSLENQVESIIGNTDGIHLLKWQPRKTIHELYIASDVFVLPSRFEALPLTIIEAINAGLHIIYTPVGGVSDILSKYAMKTMLNDITSEAIYDLLVNLVSNFSPGEIKDSISYAQKFDWGNIAIETESVYSQIMQ